MKKEKEYQIYTDASFKKEYNLATYSIVIMSENKILRTIAKSSYIEITKSTEIEILAIYQAIIWILNCYLNNNEVQKFYIKTDCEEARNFFIYPSKKIKGFEKNEKLKKEMRQKYAELSSELLKKGGKINENGFQESKTK